MREGGQVAKTKFRAFLDKGVRQATVHFEPTVFVRRRGGDSETAVPDKRGLVRRLRKAGVNLVVTRYYKGFGLDAEAAERVDTAELIRHCHKSGIRVATYCQFGTVHAETLLAEDPAYEDFFAVDRHGKYCLPYAYDSQWFRYGVSMTSRKWRAYMKRVMDAAIADGSDVIYFDNLYWPWDGCYRERTRDDFRRFLDERSEGWSKAKRRRVYGYADLSHVEPPPYPDPWKYDLVRDPVTQAWTDYRCGKLAERLEEFARHARRRNPAVGVMTNPGADRKSCYPLIHGVYEPALARGADYHYIENGYFADYVPPAAARETGTIISKVRGYKMARAIDRPMITSAGFNETVHAEAVALSMNCHQMGGDEALHKLYDKNRRLYLGSGTPGEVCVLRNYPSWAYDWKRSYWTCCLLEQALVQAHIPFDVLYRETPGFRSALAKARVAAVTIRAASDDDVRALGRFVGRGGGLLLAGEALTLDEFLRARPRAALARLLGAKGIGAKLPKPRGGAPRVERVGKGRLVGLGELTTGSTWGEISAHDHLELPPEWRGWIRALRLAAGSPLCVEIDAPDPVLAEVTVPAGGGLAVHLVDMRGEREGELGPVMLRLRDDGKRAPRLVRHRVSGARVTAEKMKPESPAGGRATGATYWIEKVGRYELVEVKR